jgi:hypothetical protein
MDTIVGVCFQAFLNAGVDNCALLLEAAKRASGTWKTKSREERVNRDWHTSEK